MATVEPQLFAARHTAAQIIPAPATGGAQGKDADVPIAVAQPYVYRASHVYQSEADARVVRNSLAVDPELRPNLVTRTLTVEGSTLHILFSATDARTLRAAVGTFYDLLALATQTLEAFGPAS